MKRIWLLMAALLLLLPAAAGAAQLYTFSAEEPPTALVDAAFAIPAQEAAITLTFAGDCTLGGEPELASHPGGFARTVQREGYAYPFSGLLPLFAMDDATLVNLEGVLSSSASNRADKQFTFLGQPEYARCLTLGSVESVTLVNNHTMDFGRRGYEDTCQALLDNGIRYVSRENVLIVEKDGYRIGITASGFGLDGQEQQRLAAQMQALREQNCLALVHVMHAGQEYQNRHNTRQQETARIAVSLGADLVVGHHPHVAQGASLLEGAPVFYSLGNGCFGGNLNPSVREGLLLQATFRFAEGEARGMEWRLYPIRTTGGETGNDYCPRLLTGGEGRQAMEQLAKRTGLPADGYTEETGAWQPALPTP